jgi:hypothetical protein
MSRTAPLRSKGKPVAIREGNGMRVFATREIALQMLHKEGWTDEEIESRFVEIPLRIRLKFAESNPMNRSTPHDRRRLRKLAARGA